MLPKHMRFYSVLMTQGIDVMVEDLEAAIQQLAANDR